MQFITRMQYLRMHRRPDARVSWQNFGAQVRTALPHSSCAVSASPPVERSLRLSGCCCGRGVKVSLQPSFREGFALDFSRQMRNRCTSLPNFPANFGAFFDESFGQRHRAFVGRRAFVEQSPLLKTLKTCGAPELSGWSRIDGRQSSERVAFE